MNKHQFKYWDFEDYSKGKWPKYKPVVSSRVIVAALVSIAVVLFVGSIVWKIANG